MSLPKLRVRKRPAPPVLVSVLSPILAVLTALGIGAILITMMGVNPLVAYYYLIYGAIGSPYNILETLVKASPLLMVALGTSIAFRCKFWNIGFEGQLTLGAVTATLIGIFVEIPGVLLIPLIFAASFAAAGLLGAIPGLLKARLRVNEIIVTIMLNYVSDFFALYLIRGPISMGGGFPQSRFITASAYLPTIPGTRFHVGVLVAFLLAGLTFVVLFKTVLGYEIRAVGASPEASRYKGIDITRTILVVSFLSAGLAGVAGAIEITGLHHRLLDGVSGGYGNAGIVVALLGKLHPLGAAAAAVFFGALFVGVEAMRRATQIPLALLLIIQGLVILLILAGEFLIRYRIERV